MTAWMVFTALDGSLLDARTLSSDAARASLQRLVVAGVPVIPVTTRTFAEVRPLAEHLDPPIIIPRTDGSADPPSCALLPEARVATAAGPRGWAAAIDEIAQNLTVGSVSA